MSISCNNFKIKLNLVLSELFGQLCVGTIVRVDNQKGGSK